jgi:hypothetical protein
MNRGLLALGVATGAFLLAFGMGKATVKDADGAPSRRAVAIPLGGAVISADVSTGAQLPALKERRPRPRPRRPQVRPQPTPTPTPPPPPSTRPLTPIQPRPMPAPDPRPSRPDSDEDGVIGGGVN